MKLSEVYRRAARIQECGGTRDYPPGACSTIADAMYPQLSRSEAYSKACNTRAIKDFEKLFKPDKAVALYWGKYWSHTDSEINDCRILALCFMAAIAEDQERERRRNGR